MMRNFHFPERCRARAGRARRTDPGCVEVDMTAFPFTEDQFVPLIACFR